MYCYFTWTDLKSNNMYSSAGYYVKRSGDYLKVNIMKMLSVSTSK